MLNRLIMLCLCSLFSINAFAITNKKTAEEFIADQNIIRVYVDDAPGYGDQSATASAMNRLRQMGFQGKFEVIYGNVTADKVSMLFNLPKNLPDVYEDTATNTTFIKMKAHFNRLNQHTIEKVNLGITVSKGSSACGVAEADGIDVDENSLLCDNNANFAYTKAFIEFNPYFSKTEPTEIAIFDQKHDIAQEESWNKFFVMPGTSMEQADIYLHKDPKGQAILAQKPGLEALIDGIWNKTLNVLPIYGYTIQSDVCNKDGDAAGCFPGNILQIITAARYAQLNGPAEMHKPLVIPVFYNYDKDATSILQMINSDNWGANEIAGANNIRTAIKQLALRDAFTIANVSDPKMNARIKALKPGEMMLLTLGPLPKVVFDGLYTHTDSNVWPQIREGAGSFNSLIMTGKPHIRCAGEWDLKENQGWEIGFDLIDDATFKSQIEKLYSKNGICDGSSTWELNANIYRSLGDLFIAAQDSHSPFSKYFVRLKAEATKPENDRIRYALDAVVGMLDSHA